MFLTTDTRPQEPVCSQIAEVFWKDVEISTFVYTLEYMGLEGNM